MITVGTTPIHTERLKPGVTLALLHVEYREQYPDGYGYTQFCEYYGRWLKKHTLTMRQEHRAGDKTFIDYSGKTPFIVDPTTGDQVAVELFVAVLGASSYTFAEVTETQRVADFCASHVRAFEFFGGVTAALVPDQLKSEAGESQRREAGGWPACSTRRGGCSTTCWSASTGGGCRRGRG